MPAASAAKLTFSGERASAELAFANFGFGDDSGTHAGEKIAAAWSLQAQLRAAQWEWQSRLEWKSGDVFWQPLFVGGSGHVLSAAGTLDAQRLAVERGQLALAGIGELDFGAVVRSCRRQARQCEPEKCEPRNRGAV